VTHPNSKLSREACQWRWWVLYGFFFFFFFGFFAFLIWSFFLEPYSINLIGFCMSGEGRFHGALLQRDLQGLGLPIPWSFAKHKGLRTRS
jgi:hypothetical protein